MVPIGDNAPQHAGSLFDHLVSAGEQRRGYGETERLCCFQIYDEFVFAWGLHRQISGFLAPQYAINVGCGASILIIKIRPIGDQSAGSNKSPLNVYRGQLVARGRCDDQIDVGCPYATRRHDQSAIWRLCEVRDGAFNLIWLAEIDWADFNANRRRRGLNDGELADPVSEIRDREELPRALRLAQSP